VLDWASTAEYKAAIKAATNKIREPFSFISLSKLSTHHDPIFMFTGGTQQTYNRHYLDLL
jgi:hypothetical protein